MRLLSPETATSPLLRAAWQDLAADASEPNPFFEPWFAGPSWEQFAPQAHCVMAAHFDGDRLTGVLPLVRSANYYGHRLPHLSVWLHANAFCGAPIVARGFERDFWRSLFAELDGAAGSALFLHLRAFPATGPMSEALRDVLAETGRPAFTVDSSTRAMLASGLDAQNYLAGAMSAKKRKELRRQHKRLEELGDLTIERLGGAEAVNPWVDEFLALEAAGWKGEAGSALANADATRAFFKAALLGAAQAGRLERLALRLDGAPVAMLANFITPPGAYSFKTTFDERFARYSPGLLLQLENLDLLDRPEIEWADSCAAEGHSMIERVWREKRTLVSRNIAIGGRLRRTAFRALMAYETRNRKAP